MHYRYLIPMLLGALICLGASAPATAQTPTLVQNYKVGPEFNGSEGFGSSRVAACTSFASALNSSNFNGGAWTVDSVNFNSGNGIYSCMLHQSGSFAGNPAVVANGSPTNTCPGGSTLVGASCVCPAGTTSWNGTTCVSACTANARMQAVGDAGAVQVGCINGCIVAVDTVICTGSGSLRYCNTFGKKIGAECTVPIAMTSNGTNPCAAGETPMMINGSQLCTVSGATQDSRSYGTTTSPDGSKVVTTTSSNCIDGACTSTSSSQPYNSSDVAQGNPTVEEKSEQDKLTMGTPIDTPVGTSGVDLNSLTPVTMGGARSCPADVPLAKGTYFTFSGACFVGDGVRPVILAMAWLAAGLIAFGGART